MIDYFVIYDTRISSRMKDERRPALRMRRGIRKHYKRLGLFISAANCAWDEISRDGEFPTLDELDPFGRHKPLLDRIERAFTKEFGEIRPAAGVPLLAYPKWRSVGQRGWLRLHCYALVRRLFDSLNFLTRNNVPPTPGTQVTPLMLQVSISDNGVISRVRDAYEDFLAELTNAGDLSRVRSCPACNRFFVAWRWDQKACRKPCANLIRVHRFRAKAPEYAEGRRFRKRAGLPAVRRGRRALQKLTEALRSS